MKKKYQVPIKDKNDWLNYTKELKNLEDKDKESNLKTNKSLGIRKIDLHGYSLSEANIKVKKFIIECSKENCQKLLIVTGKGLRSKVYENPYLSEKMNILKYSIPDYVNNDNELNNKIIKISEASPEDGGSGAFYIFLKKKEKIKE